MPDKNLSDGVAFITFCTYFDGRTFYGEWPWNGHETWRKRVRSHFERRKVWRKVGIKCLPRKCGDEKNIKVPRSMGA